MKSERRVPHLRPVARRIAGLLALAVAGSGLARVGSLARAEVAAPDVDRRAGDPRISYEVQWLEGGYVAGSAPDFVAGAERRPVRGWFVSEREQTFWVDSALRWPSGRWSRAPMVTAIEGRKATVRMPREAGRPLGDGSEIAVEVSGTVKDEHVRLSIRLTKATPGAARRGREEVEVGVVRCGLPDGGTVMLSMDAPVGGRERLVLVTPRFGPAARAAAPRGRP